MEEALDLSFHRLLMIIYIYIYIYTGGAKKCIHILDVIYGNVYTFFWAHYVFIYIYIYIYICVCVCVFKLLQNCV